MKFILRPGTYRSREPDFEFRLTCPIRLDGYHGLILLEGANGAGKTTFLEKILLKRCRRPVAYIAADKSTAAPAFTAHLAIRHAMGKRSGGLYDGVPPNLDRWRRSIYAMIHQPEVEAVILDDYGEDYGEVSSWIRNRAVAVPIVAAGNDVIGRTSGLLNHGPRLHLKIERDARTCSIREAIR